jgi:hypothetical protein
MRAALVELSCGNGMFKVVIVGVIGLGLGLHLFILKALSPSNLLT